MSNNVHEFVNILFLDHPGTLISYVSTYHGILQCCVWVIMFVYL